MKLETNENKENIEITKQQRIKTKKKLLKTIKPSKGHELFKVNLETLEIEKAVFDVKPCISWHDAVNGLHSKYKKLTVEKGHVYISALNKENVIKILKRDYQIIVK